MQVRFSEPELRLLCSIYQRELRLQDWRITVWIVRTRELGTDEGRTRWNLERRNAKILILHPDDFDSTMSGIQDMELILVHELCHLKLAQIEIDQESGEWILLEQAIEDLSEAIVMARRRPSRAKSLALVA